MGGPFTFQFWWFAFSDCDCDAITDSRGTWHRLVGRLWWLAESAQ